MKIKIVFFTRERAYKVDRSVLFLEEEDRVLDYLPPGFSLGRVIEIDVDEEEWAMPVFRKLFETTKSEER